MHDAVAAPGNVGARAWNQAFVVVLPADSVCPFHVHSATTRAAGPLPFGRLELAERYAGLLPLLRVIGVAGRERRPPV